MKRIISFFIALIVVLTYSSSTMIYAFKSYNSSDDTGTYAVDTELILIQFDFSKDVSSVFANLKLKDEDLVEIPWTQLIALNDVGGRASRYQGIPSETLDKTKTYTLVYNTLEIEVAMDTTSPVISYTNKVRNDSSMYDELESVYLVPLIEENWIESLLSEKVVFDLTPYIRLNVVDDRDGSLLDKAVIENIPNLYVAGDYDLTITATDSWDNQRSLVLHFRVFDTGDDSAFVENMAMAGGVFAFVVIILGLLAWIIIRRKKGGK